MAGQKILIGLLLSLWGWNLPILANQHISSVPAALKSMPAVNGAIVKYNQEELFPVVKNRKYGYIDGAGTIVIPTNFDGAFTFSDGLGRVKIGKKYGFINPAGQIIIAPQFDRASEFTNGLALIGQGKNLGYIDRTGRVIIANSNFTDATSFSENRAVVRIGTKYGFIDRTGQQVIPVQYKYAHPFQAGLAMVLQDDKWIFINPQGDTKLYADDLAIHFTKALKRAVYPFGQDGLARILIDGKTGYIDRRGKLVIRPQFTEAYNFTEGLAPVKIGSKYGYINTKGKLVIPAEYNTVSEFRSGLAAVRIGKKYGYIDPKGKLIVSPQFDTAFSFQGNVAAIKTSSRPGYIDRQGKIIWQAP
jgi:WG containing repeat